MSLNYFDQASVTSGQTATSTIDKADLVTAIQNDSADTYFDSTSKIGKVYVYYDHEDGSQQKKIVHEGSSLEGTVSWSTFARDGTWEKSTIKAFDHDGAVDLLYRASIGSSEDLTHSDGTTNLNVS